MDSLAQDIRYALRRLRSAPGFTAVATLTLALGTGANSAIYSVIHSVLLAPLPYADAGRVVGLANRRSGQDIAWISEPELMDFRRDVASFSGVAAYDAEEANLTGTGGPERVGIARATANLFSVLGVRPVAGRPFSAAEDVPGHDDVALLSYGLWQRRFGGQPVVGRVLRVDGRARLVIGVLPPGLRLPTDYRAQQPTDVWLPLALQPDSLHGRGSHYLYALARLRPGATPRQATAELSVVADRWAAAGLVQRPDDFRDVAVPVTDLVLGHVRPILLLLLGAVGFILLIACANVANLLLARADGRQREIAIRTAMGASRRRVVTQLLVESVLLALAGGAGGLLLAALGLRGLLALSPGGVPRIAGVHLDGPVLGVTLLLALGTGVAFGLVPALHASRIDLVPALKEGARGTSLGVRRRRVGATLVVAQVALAVVLVVGAGLMVRSFGKLRDIDIGVRPDHVLTLRLSLPPADYPGDTAVIAFYRTLLERVRALPGVRAAGAARILPLTEEMGDWSITIEGRPRQPDENPHADWQIVTPGYFQAAGMWLLRGRLLDENDRDGGPFVVVVNATMAARYWPGQDALGKRFHLGTSGKPWTTVVGIVGDVRQNAIVETPHAQMFHPIAQWPAASGGSRVPRGLTLAVRAAGDPLALARSVAGIVHGLDPRLPVSNVQTMDEVVREAVAQPRFTTTLLVLFGLLALALAAVGIYGLVAYTVGRRSGEIAIRMALGARRGRVLAMILRQGLGLTAAGLAVGLLAAAALARLMGSLLYGVGALDPLTFTAVPVLLAGVAAAACLLPARRAAAVAPAAALRAE